jgi:hypothetical protein
MTMMPPNNSMQRTALRAAADAERSADNRYHATLVWRKERQK